MEYWIWLTQLKGIGPLISRKLLNVFNTPENIFNAGFDELIKVPGIGATTATIILESKSLEIAKSILEDCHKYGIGTLTYYDPLYNSIASMYHKMPVLLYYKGEIRNTPSIAIVGSRRCSLYGKNVVIEAAKYLAENKITVISGMAKGIDGYAHTACINAGGYTIAFLGNGIDICYPKEHKVLMDSIIANGAVISEYPPGEKSKPEHFPRRNFLMSCWSEKVLVVEASKKSGALITANIATKQGKKVLAAPSTIYSITGEGTNELILKGAEIYLNPNQLLVDCNGALLKSKEHKITDRLEFSSDSTTFKNRNYSELENNILSCLKDKDKSIDEIAKSLSKRPFEFIDIITMLEIEGVIESQPNGRYTYSGVISTS